MSGLNKDSGKKAVASGEHLPQLSQEERTGSKNEKKSLGTSFETLSSCVYYSKSKCFKMLITGRKSH